MCIIMFRHHRHLHKINMKLFFTKYITMVFSSTQLFAKKYRCSLFDICHKDKGIKSTSTDRKIFVTQRFQKKYYRLNFEHISQKNHSWTIELTYPAGRKCRILEPSDFFISCQNNGEWEFYRQISFSLLGNEHFSFTLLFVSLFLLFQFLITFKVQNRPNLFKILIVTS